MGQMLARFVSFHTVMHSTIVENVSRITLLAPRFCVHGQHLLDVFLGVVAFTTVQESMLNMQRFPGI
jgi:hypothetical protein